MSSTSATELSLDNDFNQLSFQICEANRQHLISRLQGIRAESEGLVFDVLGHPTLPVLSGEVVYLFHCRLVWGRIRTATNICSQELPVILDDGRHMFMKPTSHRVSSHYTPRPCSTVTAPGFNLGTPELPQWTYLDIQGNPHSGPTPQTFNFSHMIRHGVELPDLDGVYTDVQLEALQEQTMRGDAIMAISNHLAAKVSQTHNTLSTSTFQSLLENNLQSAIEISTTPWPYNLANFLPSWLRSAIAITVVALFLSVFAKPIYACLIFASTSSVSLIEFCKMIFFSQFFAFQAHFTHRDLIKTTTAAAEDPQAVPMLPYQPDEADAQATIQQLRRDSEASVARIIALEQDNSNLHATLKHQELATKRLESAVKRLVGMTISPGGSATAKE